jgi:hypothetical protein
MLKDMGDFNEKLVKAGIMLAGEGLKPSKFGKRVKFAGAKRAVTTARSRRPRSRSRVTRSGR